MYICRYNDSKYALDIIKYIVSVDINTLKDKDNNGNTPLMFICIFNNSKYALDIIKYIVSVDISTLKDKDKMEIHYYILLTIIIQNINKIL